MDRRDVLKALLLAPLIPGTMSLSKLHRLAEDLPDSEKMPVLFVGHGNPMNALEDNAYVQSWKQIAGQIDPAPKAILCISAHWLTKGTKVTAMAKPRTIHDFQGFPKALHEVQYPAPGAPNYAEYVKEVVSKTIVGLDHDWGLDHGTWSVLAQMFPQANIPVFQLSIDYHQPPQYHYDLARELAQLRKKGVLVVGSGNIVHNLRMARMTDTAFDWAIEFDGQMKTFIQNRDHQPIIDYRKLGQAAKLAVPTPDHYYPLLYTLGMTDKDEAVHQFAESATMGAISMRSVLVGGHN